MDVEYGCRYVDVLPGLLPVAGSLVVYSDALILWWKLWVNGNDGDYSCTDNSCVYEFVICNAGR